MKQPFVPHKALIITLSFSSLLVSPLYAADPPGQKPVLKISGESKFNGYFFQNNNRNLNTGSKDRGEKSNKTHFTAEDTRLNFQVFGRAGWFGQMKYDWLVGLTGDNDKETIQENRLRLKGQWGTLLAGDHYGAENFMARGAFAVMGGVGGFDGNWHDVVNVPTGVLLTTDLIGTTKYATKLTYVSPRYSGLQVAFSYAPNSEHRATGKPHNQTSIKKPQEAFNVNSWAMGLNFQHGFTNGIQVALSATGILAKTKSPQSRSKFIADPAYRFYETSNRKQTASYALGGTTEYRGFEFGAEWINNGRSRQPGNLDITVPGGTIIGRFDAGKAYSFAAGYTFGCYKVAIGHYHSERKFGGPKSKANVNSVTCDRSLAPGLSIYLDASKAELKTSKAALNVQQAIYNGASDGSKPATPTANNKMHAVVVGGKFRF